MKRGPQPSSRSVKSSPVAKAREAWGDVIPPEIERLAQACEAGTASAVAATLGYSPAAISQVLGRKYPGDLNRVFGKIRGVLMHEVVECPVLGEIGRDRCLDEQKRPFSATNSTRARLFHACRVCPQNRKNQQGGAP